MKDGTREDYLLIEEFERKHAGGLVDRLEHSLQCATRAVRGGRG